MPIPLSAQAQVYWRTSQELHQAREAKNSVAEAEALFELMDLGEFSLRSGIKRLCQSHVPAVEVKLRRRT